MTSRDLKLCLGLGLFLACGLQSGGVPVFESAYVLWTAFWEGAVQGWQFDPGGMR